MTELVPGIELLLAILHLNVYERQLPSGCYWNKIYLPIWQHTFCPSRCVLVQSHSLPLLRIQTEAISHCHYGVVSSCICVLHIHSEVEQVFSPQLYEWLKVMGRCSYNPYHMKDVYWPQISVCMYDIVGDVTLSHWQQGQHFYYSSGKLPTFSKSTRFICSHHTTIEWTHITHRARVDDGIVREQPKLFPRWKATACHIRQ